MLSPWLNKFPLHHFPSPSLINLSSPISAMTRLSKKFPSRKNPRSIQSKSSTSSPIILSPTDSNSNHSKKANATEIAASSSSPKSMAKAKAKIGSKWSVYLIISSTLPRTYVGVTTNFPRRLKQHNGELKGGAKASSAGRPWILACLVRGFKDRSEGRPKVKYYDIWREMTKDNAFVEIIFKLKPLACEFEYKWKSISRKMARKKNKEDEPSNALLQHREAALSKVKASLSCSHLQIDWQSISH